MQGPSKTFLIRGGVATIIVAGILVSQTHWATHLFDKKPAPKIPLDPNTTIGDVIEKDTNGNGISDWEERLWGLDPTVLYTNGVPNAQLIAAKKKASVNSDTIAPPTPVDKLARDLYTLTVALGTDQTLDTSGLANAASAIANHVATPIFNLTYTSSQIKTTKTTKASLSAYQTSLKKTLTPYEDASPGIEIVINALQTGDYSQLPDLARATTQYATVAKTMKGMTVPIGLLQYHLDIINGLAGMSKAFVYLQNLDTNGLDALSGITLYQGYNTSYTKAIIGLSNYLKTYGILSSI